ncbi:MAG: SulP family inorganic anion transporter, partial [Oscillospiraceae bacterium]
NLILKQDIALVGQIPATLLPADRLNLSVIPFERINEFILPAFTIAALCMIESLLCGASGGKVRGEKLDADQELFAQAFGNIILPFFGAIPAASALSRTSVALKSVGTTRMTSVFHSIALILAILFLGPVISAIPLSALAGILMITAWRMNDFESINYIFQRKFLSSILQYLFTFMATICFDLTIAIFVGVIVSILIFMVNISEMVITVSDVDPKRLVDTGVTLKETSQKIRIVYLVGPVFFGNMEKLEDAISTLGVNDVVIFSMRGVPFMDAGSAQVFLHLVEYLIGNDVVPMFSSLQPKVKQVLDRSGVTEVVGGEHFFWDASSAIAFCGDI